MFDPHSSDNSSHVERGVSASENGIKIVLRIAARGRMCCRILAMDAILCMLFVHCSISQYKVSTRDLLFRG
jgi:hypothetical protein